MTCIISLSTPRYVVQTSDRRVSRVADHKAVGVHNEEANKAIIFGATDGVASIGYTGVAYIGKIPTDRWLAELLWGKPIMGALGFGGSASTCRIADAIHKLRHAMDRHAAVFSGLEVLISGFRLNRQLWVPFEVRLRRVLGTPTTFAGNLRMRGPGLSIKAVGSTPTRQEMELALARLAQQRTRPITADQTADALTGLVRVVAARDQGVGINVMTTIINPPGHGPVICRFSPFGERSQAVLKRDGQPDTPIGPADFSPWIIGQHGTMSPSVIVGGATGTTLSAGGLEVRLEGPAVTPPAGQPGFLFAMSSQDGFGGRRG